MEYCESLYVRNGMVDCEPSNMISGANFSFSCYAGYELSFDSVISKKCEGISFSDEKVKLNKNKLSIETIQNKIMFLFLVISGVL